MLSSRLFALAVLAGIPTTATSQVTPAMIPLGQSVGPIGPAKPPGARPATNRPGRGGFWGNPAYWYPAYDPNYDYDTGYRPQPRYQPPVFDDPPEPQFAPQRLDQLSRELPATLVMEFPAAAEVWVNGVKGDGKPDTEWTLTSPPLKRDEQFTFRVRARWTAGAKTYEAERTVAVATGKRSRAMVVLGAEVKE